jgi:transposase
LEPYRKFAELIESHWDGIASYCHPDNKVSLGLVEGVNNKIRVLQRRAHGYRNEEYLKLKIVAAFLPPLPRNANIHPHFRVDPVELKVHYSLIQQFNSAV